MASNNLLKTFKNPVLIIFITLCVYLSGLAFSLWSLTPSSVAEERPILVPLKRVMPDITLDLRYTTRSNFTGQVVPGYQHHATCLVTPSTAQALLQVETTLRQKGFRLVVYDCYRPQEAVDAFYEWSLQPDKPKPKRQYYPNEAKQTLFEKGYIAKTSNHTQGHTVDLSLLQCPVPKNSNRHLKCKPVEMGTPFDFFDVASHTDAQQISEQAKQNRRLLKSAMEAEGFTNLPQEWWHYSLLKSL
jgi:D-alanyl-D-alanine dipeptidase